MVLIEKDIKQVNCWAEFASLVLRSYKILETFSYRFETNLLSPSVNGAYVGKTRRFLSGKAKLFKKQLAMEINSDPDHFIAGLKANHKILRFDLAVCTKRWLTKNGKVRKNDLSNRIKLFEDTFFECLGVDDSFVFEMHVYKVYADDKTACRVSILDNYMTELPF